jgi:hypothetical protein
MSALFRIPGIGDMTREWQQLPVREKSKLALMIHVREFWRLPYNWRKNIKYVLSPEAATVGCI